MSVIIIIYAKTLKVFEKNNCFIPVQQKLNSIEWFINIVLLVSCGILYSFVLKILYLLSFFQLQCLQMKLYKTNSKLDNKEIKMDNCFLNFFI